MTISGGTFTIAAASTIEKDFTYSATLTGSGDLIIKGHFHRAGGTVSGSGQVTLAAGAALTIDGDQHVLAGRALVNNGAAVTLASTLHPGANLVALPPPGIDKGRPRVNGDRLSHATPPRRRPA